MLGMILALSLTLASVAAGCGDDSVNAGSGMGGIGGAGPCSGMMFEPGPTCTAFCAKAIGECEFLLRVTEAECRQGCEQSLCEEGAKSEACGDAVEAVFACATELDCQGVYDWRDKEPPDAYPCFDEVSFVGTVCP